MSFDFFWVSSHLWQITQRSRSDVAVRASSLTAELRDISSAAVFKKKQQKCATFLCVAPAAEDLCVQDGRSNRKSSLKRRLGLRGNSEGLINEPKSKNYQKINR